MTERAIKKLELRDGKIPFNEWYSTLSDTKVKAAVNARIARMRAGNFGDHKFVGEGVFEMRIDLGPGWRIYFAREGDLVVILIGGGDKRTQARDISRAQQLWKSYEAR